MEPSLHQPISSTRERFVPTSQPQLPTELLDAIFKLCDPKCYPSIHLTSKAFSQIIKPLFFSQVTVHLHPRWDVPSYDHFGEFLHLCPFIRVLEIVTPCVYVPTPTEGVLEIQAENIELAFQALPRLLHFAFDFRSFGTVTPPSSLDGYSERVYIPGRGRRCFVPPILRAALLHPTLEDLNVPYLRPDWLTHPTIPLPRRPINRPLVIPILTLASRPDMPDGEVRDRYGLDASVILSLVAQGIQAQEIYVHFDFFSSDLMELVKTPLPTLHTLHIQLDHSGNNPNSTPLDFPLNTFQRLVASHPHLRTIKVRGRIMDEVLRRQINDFLWVLLSKIHGCQCIEDSRSESWRTEYDLSPLGMTLSLGASGGKIWGISELELDLISMRRELPLVEVLEGIGRHFVDLESLSLAGEFTRPKYGQLRLPSGLFPSLEYLTLPLLPAPILHPPFSISSSSTCPHHPSLSSSNERDQDLADALNLAGGPIALWKQEILPRITSDATRIGIAFPLLQRVVQPISVPYRPHQKTYFTWTIRGVPVNKFWGVSRAWNGVEMGFDEVGWCSCGGWNVEGWEGDDDDGRKLQAWREEREKTPLFELEPNFAPAFYLDDFFPKVSRPSRT